MYQKIKVSLIDVQEGRLRDVDQDWADCLAGMFLETGQKTPIDVVASDKRFTLVAGAHRLTAAGIAKWKEIDARVLEPQGEQAAEELRLHEILEILQLLQAEINGHLREELLQKGLDLFLIKRSIEWLRTQLRKLEELGAVSIDEDEGKLIAGITRTGRDHMERRSQLSGVAAPDDKV